MSAVAEAPTQGKTAYPSYRTMTPNKKTLALLGHVSEQEEWMREEIQEFLEAMHLNNRADIIDEGLGLLLTAQAFPNTLALLKPYEFYVQTLMHMIHLPTEYAKFAAKKHAKGQASSMTLEGLVQVFEDLCLLQIQ